MPKPKPARLERETFTTSRQMEYFSPDELTKQIGHDVDLWPIAITKELIDNALDACEAIPVSPLITVTLEGERISVADNAGDGLPEPTLTGSLDYNVTVSNKASPSQIEAWQTELLKRVGKSTVASARTALFGACKKAVQMHMIRSNPVAGTDGTGRGKPRRYHLSIDEALRLVAACEGERLGLLFELSLTTGLRPEEAIDLTWVDLDLTGRLRGALRVRRVVHHLKGGGWCWQEPKTVNSERKIVFPAELVAKLVDHRKAQLEQKLKVGQYWQNNDLVFTTRLGSPIRYCLLYKHFRKIIDRAKLASAATPYSLRHAFVTFSLVAGVDAKTVSREAGHYKVAFTLDRYGTVLDEMHETASDKRENLLKDAQNDTRASICCARNTADQ
jgi:integrase